MAKLTVCIITLNEETDLANCLETIKDIADEIVIVDSGSTDKTVEVAYRFQAKVYSRKFDNYANQKNFASSKASGDWIFFIDADEWIEKELAEDIKTVINNSAIECVAYSMPRKNIILGKFIRFTRWQPELDRHIWLYKKDCGKWQGEVHEEFIPNGDVGKLKHAKWHHQYDTVSEFLSMINRYSELEANQRYERGERFSILEMFWRPKYNFIIRYFYRLGFLDGWRGFVLSFLMGIYHLSVEVKLWSKTNI